MVGISGLVTEIRRHGKTLEVKVAGKGRRFHNVRLRAIGKAAEFLEGRLQEGKAYFFTGDLLPREDTGFELGAVYAFPVEGEIAKGQYGPYLEDASNTVVLQGRLGKDADVRLIETDEGGLYLATFRVAVRSLGEKTAWVPVKAWDLPEGTLDRLKKGAPVYVEGEYRLERYEKEGKTHYRHVVVAHKVVVGSSTGNGEKEGAEEEVPF